MSANPSHPRIALSLSPTGANASPLVRLSPELIQAHVRRAHALRSEAMWCVARQAWNWLTRKDRSPDWGVCADEALLRPAA